MNSSSFSTNDSNAFATSALNLHKKKQWSLKRVFYFPNKLYSYKLLAQRIYLSISSSAMMTLSLNLGSALFSHQNWWVFFLCSGLKPDTCWISKQRQLITKIHIVQTKVWDKDRVVSQMSKTIFWRFFLMQNTQHRW